jgi:hypothetical protein
MYEEINQQLEEAQQQIFRQKKLMTMLEELKKQRLALADKVKELQGILEKENEDVDKLEGKSLAHMFYSVLGKIGEQVEKERKEALAAKLKYDQAVQELEQVNNRIMQQEEELIGYRNCKGLYDSLYEKKKQLIMNAGSATAQQVMELQQQMKESANNLKEIKEAISAGNRVSNYIDRAISSLESAEGWGTWDLIGGGLISDIAKHSHIDDAKLAADGVQQELSNFRTELADVRIQNDIHFEMDGFAKFADFFFDGLIADWCMQSRIEDSLGSVRNVKNQVNEVLRRLEMMEGTEADSVKGLENRINNMIQEA